MAYQQNRIKSTTIKKWPTRSVIKDHTVLDSLDGQESIEGKEIQQGEFKIGLHRHFTSGDKVEVAIEEFGYYFFGGKTGTGKQPGVKWRKGILVGKNNEDLIVRLSGSKFYRVKNENDIRKG